MLFVAVVVAMAVPAEAWGSTGKASCCASDARGLGEQTMLQQRVRLQLVSMPLLTCMLYHGTFLVAVGTSV